MTVETPTQVLSYEFGEIFKNNFFKEHLRWLLLRLQQSNLLGQSNPTNLLG